MITSILLTANDPAWNQYISRVPHDFYHRAEYHTFEELNGEGTPYLFVSFQDQQLFAWPYLLKPVRIPGVAAEFETMEVSACYGYPGPLSSADASEDFLTEAFGQLIETWREQRAVTAFTRFHPVLPTAAAFRKLEDLGVFRNYHSPENQALTLRGQTVSINVAQPTAERRAGYRADARRHVRKNKEAGAVTICDEQFQHLPAFCDYYDATMTRNGAESSYRFDLPYFERLQRAHPGIIHLFVTMQGDDVLCAALISEYQRQMQAVFIMSNPAFMGKSPAKALVDDVCEWGLTHGALDFHLGGGVGARRDSLFEFKAGFSSFLRDFYTMGLVIDHQEYNRLVDIRRSVDALDPASRFFPAWRSPLSIELSPATSSVMATRS